MAEWTNAPALKAGGPTASWVQIPVPPHSDANQRAEYRLCVPVSVLEMAGFEPSDGVRSRVDRAEHASVRSNVAPRSQGRSQNGPHSPLSYGSSTGTGIRVSPTSGRSDGRRTLFDAPTEREDAETNRVRSSDSARSDVTAVR